MKRLFTLVLGLILLLGVAGCTESDPTPPPEAKALTTPVVSIDEETGLASWRAVTNASGYAYRIDEGEETATSERSVQLEAAQSIRVKAVGDGTNYTDSAWSEAATYTGPVGYSYVLTNGGQESSGLNIYTVDGEYVLETAWGDKPHGDLLKPGVEYIFEFDGALGSYKSGLLFCGVENAKISDVVWSDRTYDDREGENTVGDELYEVKYKNHYNEFGDYGSFHRVDWGNYWGGDTYGWDYGEKKTMTDGVYDTSAEGFWTEAVNECACFYGEHWLATGKSLAQVANMNYIRMKITFDSFDDIWGPSWPYPYDECDSLLGRTGFNFFGYFNSFYHYAFLTGYIPEEVKGAENSYVVDQNGDRTAGVNIYDAATGELVLNSMTEAAAAGLLETGKEYVFEFQVSGNADTALLFAGIKNASVKDLVWSDKLYSDREGETTVSDKLYVANFNHSTGASQALYHRLKWDAEQNCYTYIKGAECGENLSGFSPDWPNMCPEFFKTNFYATGLRVSEADKEYFRMTITFSSFQHIGCGAVVTDETHANYGKLSARDFNMFVHHAGGSYSLYLANALPEVSEEGTEEA